MAGGQAMFGHKRVSEPKEFKGTYWCVPGRRTGKMDNGVQTDYPKWDRFGRFFLQQTRGACNETQ